MTLTMSSKCTVLYIRRVRKKAWTMPEYDILSNADTLRNLGVNDNFQYLGVTFNVAKGIDNSEILRRYQ